MRQLLCWIFALWDRFQDDSFVLTRILTDKELNHSLHNRFQMSDDAAFSHLQFQLTKRNSFWHSIHFYEFSSKTEISKKKCCSRKFTSKRCRKISRAIGGNKKLEQDRSLRTAKHGIEKQHRMCKQKILPATQKWDVDEDVAKCTFYVVRRSVDYWNVLNEWCLCIHSIKGQQASEKKQSMWVEFDECVTGLNL